MSIATLPYVLGEACPISWPQPTALMLDYPLLPQTPELAVDFVHRAYIEALWLPESIVTLSSLVLSLRRVQRTAQAEHPLPDLLRPLLLPLKSIEAKYQEHLPGLLRDPATAMEREVIEPEENAMWYAWHHGKPPSRHFPDPDQVDNEKWKKHWMLDMERREVLVQILLHLIFMTCAPPSSSQSPPPDRSRKRKRKSLRDSPVKGKRTARRERSPSPARFSVEENFDLLTDRLAIWQATEEDAEKFLKRPGDEERDWMRVFFEDEVRPLFLDQLADQIRAFEEKIVPPTVRERTPDSDESLPEPKQKSTKTQKAPSPKRTLTEADLAEERSGSLSRRKSKSRVIPQIDVKTSLIRSRSISVEPDAEGRRSRSRSVSLAAEDLKSFGGKRGGITSNSKLFASEVDMRRQATSALKRVSSSTSVTFGETAESRPPWMRESSVETVTRAPVGGTTLVAETPPRPTSKQSWTFVENSDDEGVPESPELVYLGTRSAERVIPETPIKKGIKQGPKR